MSKHIRFDDENLDEYDPSDSEEEYDENERELLKKVRNRRQDDSESENEVLNVRADQDDDDDDESGSEVALSDIEGQEDKDDIPDVRAWGKDKKKFYGADYVDQDYGGFQGKDAHSAEIEEEEAKNLQNQLVQQLDDDDFSLGIFFKKNDTNKEKNQIEEVIKTDISKLSKKQKLQILNKESPEFFGLVNDFEAKIIVAQKYLRPCLKKTNNVCFATEFVQTYYQLILNYCTNIYMYLLLKSKKELQNHPIIKRLYQYRQLLSQLDPIFEETIKPQIEILLSEQETTINANNSNKKNKKKTLNILQNIVINSTTKQEKKKKKVTFDDVEPSSKKIKLDQSTLENNTTENIDESLTTQEPDDIETQNEENEVSKRAITYQMAKNKGLTPHRKKEQRNPRVKHRLKFKKAITRRKGAVREPRKELSRYSGEISGIKATVSKSIKIKT